MSDSEQNSSGTFLVATKHTGAKNAVNLGSNATLYKAYRVFLMFGGLFCACTEETPRVLAERGATVVLGSGRSTSMWTATVSCTASESRRAAARIWSAVRCPTPGICRNR